MLGALGAALVLEARVTGPSVPRAAGARRALVAVVFGLFALYTAALPWLGYRLSTALFVAAAQWSLGSQTLRGVPACLAAGVATALVTYAVFQLYLQVLLPRGTLVP